MPNKKLVKHNLDITNYPFDTDQVLATNIELSPSGKYLIISIMDDTILNIKYIE